MTYDEKIKRFELSPVKIKFGKNIYNGVIRGFRNHYATVSFVLGEPATGKIINCEFSWNSVNRAVENNTVLVY